MKFFKNPIVIALILLALANLVLFWQFYFKRLLPFPGNLMVSFYFPWNGGGFAGFDPWTTRKGVTGMDVIRMMYPWKSLVVDQIKNLQIPLWNPFNFSGAPLLANLQSSVFSPVTLLLVLFPFLSGWVGSVLFLPFLFSVFWYIFLRSLKLSNFAAIFGAIAAANLTYLNVWTEQLVVLQSILFLPLVLWSLVRKHLLLAAVFSCLLIFGGHPQTILYSLIVIFLFALVLKIPPKFIALLALLTIGLSAIQWVPSLELYRHSAREDSRQIEFISTTTLPWKNLATIVAPDYFGNPGNYNFRGRNYDNSTAFVTVSALALALLAIIGKHRFQETRFYLGLALFGLIFSLWPFALIFQALHLPILSTGYLSRNIFFLELGVAILGAYGLDYLLTASPNKRKLLVPGIFLGIFLGLLWTISFFFPPTERLVSARNLVLPTAVLIVLLLSVLILKKRAAFVIIGLVILETGYFFNKYQQFAPAKFVFPSHPVFSFLQTTAGINRYFGFDRSYIDNNFATYYRVFAPEGYDPLFIRRYGEFLAGRTDKIPPYDAYVAKKDDFFRQRSLDILGVKYLVDVTDSPDVDRGQNWEKFPGDKFGFVTQINKWKFYERKTALPRDFLVSNFLVETDSQKIIEKLFNPDFDPRKTVILETQPEILPKPGGFESVTVKSYQPNSVTLETSAEEPKVLFLSDNFYPGWKATLDGTMTKILRANYSFRAVGVPRGTHIITFNYLPESFTAGWAISLVSLIILICLKLRK